MNAEADTLKKYYIEITKKIKDSSGVREKKNLTYGDLEDAKAVFKVLLNNFEKYHALRIWKYEKED